MALKNFFTGKSGVKFWVNIVMMVLIIVAMPVGALYMLDSFTHHGEKIEVPNVLGKSLYDAETMLKDRGLVALVVADGSVAAGWLMAGVESGTFAHPVTRLRHSAPPMTS